jgi:hypothetical protein
MMTAGYLQGLRAVAVATILLFATATVSLAQDLTGAYLFNGLHPGSGLYSGSLDIGQAEGALSLYRLAAGEEGREGYALQLDKVLGGIDAKPGDGAGIVLYRVKGGELEGIWNGLGNFTGSEGREDLSGPAGLEGAYAITLGLNPNQSRYAGSVEIRRTGQTYMVDWSTPDVSYVGTGVMIGDILVVGYARDYRPRVWAYCVDGPIFAGLTAAGEDRVAVPEILWPIEADIPTDAAARLAAIQSRGRVDCAQRPVAVLSQTVR